MTTGKHLKLSKIILIISLLITLTCLGILWFGQDMLPRQTYLLPTISQPLLSGMMTGLLIFFCTCLYFLTNQFYTKKICLKFLQTVASLLLSMGSFTLAIAILFSMSIDPSRVFIFDHNEQTYILKDEGDHERRERIHVLYQKSSPLTMKEIRTDDSPDYTDQMDKQTVLKMIQQSQK